MSWSLVENTYGKSRVRVTKVERNGSHHELKEFTVEVLLRGEFDKAYLEGDNSQVIPTDTMRNTCYAIASHGPIGSIEEYGKKLGEHFLTNFSHVATVSLSIVEDVWNRIAVDGKPHEHSFVATKEKRVANLDIGRGGGLNVESGLQDLTLLKTTHSEFTGYIKDKYTTLQETRDRIFGTAVSAHWVCKADKVDYNAVYEKTRQTILNVFCAHHSLGVQHTLWEMGKEVLQACPDIEEIRLDMPNQHRIPFDLTRIGLENKNEVFVTTDEPSGFISGTVARAAVAAATR